MTKVCWWRHRQKLWRHNLFFQNTYILRRARVVSFADFIKFAKMFIKATFKDSERVKIIRNYVLKCSLYLHLVTAFLWKNADTSRTHRMCQLIYVYFISSLSKVQLCQVSLLRDLCDRFYEKLGGSFWPFPSVTRISEGLRKLQRNVSWQAYFFLISH